MAPVGEGQGLSAKRAQFAGPSGLKGLLHNGKTTLIATFAALGGFVYGCELILQLSGPKDTLTLSNRQPGNVRSNLDHGSIYESRMLYIKIIHSFVVLTTADRTVLQRQSWYRTRTFDRDSRTRCLGWHFGQWVAG